MRCERRMPTTRPREQHASAQPAARRSAAKSGSASSSRFFSDAASGVSYDSRAATPARKPKRQDARSLRGAGASLNVPSE